MLKQLERKQKADEKMKKTVKITAALDEMTFDSLEAISLQDKVTYSETIRRALHCYSENKVLPKERCTKYLDLLSGGEHVIIDIDHWFLFLESIQSSQDQETFWTKHRGVAHSHGEQLKNTITTVEDLLIRLEVCNLFKLIKHSNSDFTLVLGSELPKKFIMTFLEESLAALGLKAEIKANLSKINVHTQPIKRL